MSSGEVNQGYIESTEKFITQKGLENSSAKWVPKDCVVIAMYGATAGKVGYIRIPLTTNQAVCSLLPCSEFNCIVGSPPSIDTCFVCKLSSSM